MENEGSASDRAGPHDFAFKMFEDLQLSNPEIARIIGRARAKRSDLSPRDFLMAISVLFESLQNVAKSLGHPLPQISSGSANMAWNELCEAPDSILDREGFDQFRETIDCEFRLKLNQSIASSRVKELVEHTFAVILKAIQNELARSRESRTAG